MKNTKKRRQRRLTQKYKKMGLAKAYNKILYVHSRFLPFLGHQNQKTVKNHEKHKKIAKKRRLWHFALKYKKMPLQNAYNKVFHVYGHFLPYWGS